ncbi:MAG TPA: hypothetical protein VJ373_06925 [Desulfatiglandales bacterium]|nr:hypothetical protein [Desulfatiglandales bacterium]
MKKFKYEITKHPSSEFKQLAYFCTDQGECALEELPSNQTDMLKGLLNERGEQGWELVQLFFGKDGIVAVWKKKI